jgi:hypothetical protein
MAKILCEDCMNCAKVMVRKHGEIEVTTVKCDFDEEGFAVGSTEAFQCSGFESGKIGGTDAD